VLQGLIGVPLRLISMLDQAPNTNQCVPGTYIQCAVFTANVMHGVAAAGE